ncbi:MAG: hypothetical protein JWM96_1018 [Alphaproteobacteria bacterium]|nr:hypothetical protein [Alphaproteobacteria bacterium]
MQKEVERIEKFERCFSTAYKKLEQFLNDPEKALVYNQHVCNLLEKEDPSLQNYYEVTSGKTGLFKQFSIQKEITDDFVKTNTAGCFTSLENKESIPDMDVVIEFGEAKLDKDPEIVIQKTILHGLTHAYLSHGRRTSNFYLNKQQEISADHIEELCCDAVSDIIFPFPSWGQIRLKDDIRQEHAITDGIEFVKNNRVLFTKDNDEEFEQRLAIMQGLQMMHQDSKQSDGDTHPKTERFLQNSEMITDRMAESRVNDYLDKIYNGYVPTPIPGTKSKN